MLLPVGFPRLSSFRSCMLWEDEAIQWVDHEGSSHAESLRGSCPMGRMGRVFPGGVYLSWLWIVSLNVTCRQNFSQFGKQKIPRSRTQQIQYLAKATLHFPALLCRQCDRRKESKKAKVRLPSTSIYLFYILAAFPPPSSTLLMGMTIFMMAWPLWIITSW